MNPRDFLMMCEGFNFKNRKYEDDRIIELRMLRWIGSLIYNTNVKKKDQVTDLDKLFYLPPLSTEVKENKKINIPTKEEMAEIAAWTMPRKLDDKTIEDFLNKK